MSTTKAVAVEAKERSRWVLVPTELELEGLKRAGGLPEGAGRVALCGLGPIAAAARCAELLHRGPAGEVILVGIAGSLDETRIAVGEAHEFGAVSLDGVGVGEGDEARPLAALGLPQWTGDPQRGVAPIGDHLRLAGGSSSAGASLPELLTVCAASASFEHAALRRGRHPQATAEDMEGFGVALACALAGAPLRIFRGISNRAGDRQVSSWRIDSALAAVRRLVLERLF